MKTISGGQTGVDRTALEVAKDLGFETGGWAPKGWRTDEGPDPSLKDFGLEECESVNYPRRTALNVEAADLTVVFGNDKSPGCSLTKRLCDKFGKPFIVNPTPEELIDRIDLYKVKVLNIAGNRMRINPTASAACRSCLRFVLAELILRGPTA